jgi:hypothetical protein
VQPLLRRARCPWTVLAIDSTGAATASKTTPRKHLQFVADEPARDAPVVRSVEAPSIEALRAVAVVAARCRGGESSLGLLHLALAIAAASALGLRVRDPWAAAAGAIVSCLVVASVRRSNTSCDLVVAAYPVLVASFPPGNNQKRRSANAAYSSSSSSSSSRTTSYFALVYLRTHPRGRDPLLARILVDVLAFRLASCSKGTGGRSLVMVKSSHHGSSSHDGSSSHHHHNNSNHNPPLRPRFSRNSSWSSTDS